MKAVLHPSPASSCLGAVRCESLSAFSSSDMLVVALLILGTVLALYCWLRSRRKKVDSEAAGNLSS